ncbi:eukaryotic translation initiation factor 4E type 2 [Salpingoeca rosetta]|uniref:Eukaryotic translation initiation factor 4E type 2 n=1 Tax=Salpingoeca rosetta (strain ATCC 50818 / BSB-021) TaxID=946362 RepID=F2UJ05_SALR5|nr:eukaryotic translation initiation factor 4E type 2 [Salpingoeca rosetta]EGD76953.1 eukaryotic translation initiation factor 4E type 2 [Salpingoeca rosetta]|eukprot:XP_004990793.1 eukaryotic translation initiation factor 4E type 2 [Salpingoeca rosetta]
MEKSFFDVAASGARKRKQEHPLKYTWQFWFSKKVPRQRFAEYAENLRTVGTFKTIERFWRYYSHMKKPSQLEACNIHIFKDGIQPMWEDSYNKNGGKWVVRLRKGLASRCWENVLFAIIGEQFDVGDDICGAVLAIRPHEDLISIWHRDGENTRSKAKIEETMLRVLDLGKDVAMSYVRHDVILSTVTHDHPAPVSPHSTH